MGVREEVLEVEEQEVGEYYVSMTVRNSVTKQVGVSNGL
jgi:hypothetical protein